MSTKILTSFPDNMIDEMNFACQREGRTRSDLMREAVRQYLTRFKREYADMPIIEITERVRVKNSASLPKVEGKFTQAPQNLRPPSLLG